MRKLAGSNMLPHPLKSCKRCPVTWAGFELGAGASAAALLVCAAGVLLREGSELAVKPASCPAAGRAPFVLVISGLSASPCAAAVGSSAGVPAELVLSCGWSREAAMAAASSSSSLIGCIHIRAFLTSLACSLVVHHRTTWTLKLDKKGSRQMKGRTSSTHE